jgi:hypothetical protein
MDVLGLALTYGTLIGLGLVVAGILMLAYALLRR